uniref:Uncharacterized protein n=1 Tax=Globodera rostochiensis TaxID=31243 RepID=A0A914HFW3_GLORO
MVDSSCPDHPPNSDTIIPFFWHILNSNHHDGKQHNVIYRDQEKLKLIKRQEKTGQQQAPLEGNCRPLSQRS